MSTTAPQDQPVDTLHLISSLLEENALDQVDAQLRELHPADIAHLLESLPREQRTQLWERITDNAGEILLHLNDETRASLVKEMADFEMVEATKGLDADDLADFISELPEDLTEQILLSLSEDHRRRVEAVMSYPEDTAGGLMNLDTITVRADISLDVVQRFLRFRGEIPEMTDHLIVTNREGTYMGTIALTDLLTKDLSLTVAEIINRDTDTIQASTPAKEVAAIFERRDLVSAPVVDENQRLLGRVTIDDVVDVIREEADRSMLNMAGLNEEEDMFAPAVSSARRRTVWLGINLLTALLASWVIGNFEATIEKLVALAVLMPIVASMGGIAGSQTLTLVIRGIALGQVHGANARRLLIKEMAVGALNGGIWAIIVAVVAMLWFQNYQLGLVIGVAMLLNLFAAGLAGATIPLALKRFGIDPALAGGVLLTTVTDVVGFLAFLGLATLLLI